MPRADDFLVEILTEELPPKSLNKLGSALMEHLKTELQKASLPFESIHYFATPRRLAVLVKKLADVQPDQNMERRGPALAAAFDANGQPSKACLGFARSLGVTPEDLITIKNHQGEWVGYQQTVKGKTLNEIMPNMVDRAAQGLPIPKRMRWGEGDSQFVRPVLSVIMLYGEEIIDATILGCQSGRVTRGHRFLSPDVITIPNADTYESLLATEGYVMADFKKRAMAIREQTTVCVTQRLGNHAHAYIESEDFLHEVTGLVEWPVAYCGQFDRDFLSVPQEVLISAMQEHQRYFPVLDADNHLLPYFIVISNIDSRDKARVIHGNERVLRARLADAAFFYETDKKQSLTDRVSHLKGIVFQSKLGTLYDKTVRISQLVHYLADKCGQNVKQAERAGMLCKTDLMTHMVGEFPELQGVMGYYYALHDGEENAVAVAIKEQYLPRFAGDGLPQSTQGRLLALADRIDTLVGSFGVNDIPTGDKDPFGLRRAALGVLRILVDASMSLDLKMVLTYAMSLYSVQLDNSSTVEQLLDFLQERLRAHYQEQGVKADVFASVAALNLSNPYDIDKRIRAVMAFKQLNEAEMLCIANKRVSNILTKYVDNIDAKIVDPALFEGVEEKTLAQQLAIKRDTVIQLSKAGQYEEALVCLSELREPVDVFFDHVMVMTEDKKQRENRLLLLSQLRDLFLQVADIALLQ